MKGPEEILEFWLDEIGPSGWFKQDNELDATIRERFETTLSGASEGRFSLCFATLHSRLFGFFDIHIEGRFLLLRLGRIMRRFTFRLCHVFVFFSTHITSVIAYRTHRSGTRMGKEMSHNLVSIFFPGGKS